MPANILNLPSYTVTALEQNEHDYHINAEVNQPPTACLHCKSVSLVGFGRREQLVRDLPSHGKRVGLYVDTRSYTEISETAFESWWCVISIGSPATLAGGASQETTYRSEVLVDANCRIGGLPAK